MKSCISSEGSKSTITVTSGNNQAPKAGIGVMVLKDGKVLLAKRKGSHGDGEYAFPGGHLEFWESFERCAKREAREEAGIEIDNVRFLFLANIKKYGGKHYIHIGLIGDWKGGVPKVLEPEKSETWGWYTLENVPEPLFEMCRLSFESYKTKQNYFDS